ncbi:hypothetical protein BCO26_2836 [Heyndrickxia coagulans 2-6]|nr:hypothetical protein BCO26_2836 [Heyndrickxia coagulans 2-6]
MQDIGKVVGKQIFSACKNSKISVPYGILALFASFAEMPFSKRVIGEKPDDEYDDGRKE